MRTRLLEDAKQQVEGLLRMEQEQTWTQNEVYFSDSKEKYLSQLVARQVFEEKRRLSAAGVKKEDKDWEQTVLAQSAGLLELIAGAQAYHEVRVTSTWHMPSNMHANCNRLCSCSLDLMRARAPGAPQANLPPRSREALLGQTNSCKT